MEKLACLGVSLDFNAVINSFVEDAISEAPDALDIPSSYIIRDMPSALDDILAGRDLLGANAIPFTTLSTNDDAESEDGEPSREEASAGTSSILAWPKPLSPSNLSDPSLALSIALGSHWLPISPPQ